MITALFCIIAGLVGFFLGRTFGFNDGYIASQDDAQRTVQKAAEAKTVKVTVAKAAPVKTNVAKTAKAAKSTKPAKRKTTSKKK